MQTVDDEPLETIHLYVVREEAKPPLLPVFLSVFALSILLVLCVLSPPQQPETRMTLRVPAVLLPLQTFTAEASIVPTGIKTYPATVARGILTITNGSVISQTLPAGLIFISNNGVSVATDTAVFVPAGSANGFGVATVQAHALISGKSAIFHRTLSIVSVPMTYIFVTLHLFREVRIYTRYPYNFPEIGRPRLRKFSRHSFGKVQASTIHVRKTILRASAKWLFHGNVSSLPITFQPFITLPEP